jgi:deoxyribodipyrimidine photo-lyase
MTRGLHWFRNDLRIQDNTALSALCGRADEILPVFVFDPRIAGGETSAKPRRLFLLDCLERLRRDLQKRGLPLLIRSGQPERVLPQLLHETRAQLLSFNRDTTPFAKIRDAAVRDRVEKEGREVLTRVDHVVFSSGEIRSLSGKPYAVYSPYRKAWWKRWENEPRLPDGRLRLPPPIPGFSADPIPARSRPGLCNFPTGGTAAARRRLDRFLERSIAGYHTDRDLPELDGTSRLSPYLRFGAISPRQCFERALLAAEAEPPLRTGVQKWLDELIWREFYSGILEEHPRVLTRNHRKEYDALVWNDDAKGFEDWSEGRTGYPMVDAGMRQLRATGWMHNRPRMIVASFLTKDLLIDWREGARLFFERLVDGDPASNSGGWQWAASTGTDAQPYFRIFNPVAQSRRWDPNARYLKRWVPELRKLSEREAHAPWETQQRVDYPPPIIDHAEGRRRALARFRHARQMGARG